MLNKLKINKIRRLKSEGYSIRKIAKRLKISKDTVMKYSKLAPSIKEIQPTPGIRPTEKTSNLTTDSKNEEPCSLFRSNALGSLRIGGMSPSEYLKIHSRRKYYYDQNNEPARRRGISFDQPYRYTYYYPEKLGYNNQYKIPLEENFPSINVDYQKTLEDKIKIIKKSIKEQEQEKKYQKNKQDLTDLSKKIDRVIEWHREQWEHEKKLRQNINQKLFSNENNKKIEPLHPKQVITQQNKEKILALKPTVPETTHHASIDYKEMESETKEINLMPAIATGLEIAVDLGFFDYIGRKIGEHIFKPEKPKRVHLREVNPVRVSLQEVKKKT